MTMESLDRARKHPENQEPEQQKAIDLARKILIDFDVVDPGLPKIEISAQGSPEEDVSIVFGCDNSQIARNPNEIKDGTKAYVGSLVHYDSNGAIIPIFNKIGHLEHIYTSFPEGRIRKETISIGGKTSKELQKEFNRRINVSPYAEDMMKSKDFVTLKEPENINLIHLKVQDLELEGIPTTDEVYARGQALGLNLCPAEAGPHRRLKDTDQPLGDWYFIAMKQITDRDGNPHVFSLARDGDGLWLRGGWAYPTRGWRPGDELIFSLRK